MSVNDQNGAALGQAFTQNVIDAMGPKTDPRLREVMTGLIRHIHDFAREVRLTTDEWMAGVEMINQAGRMSDDKRNEGQLLCDVIGLESLVDDITFAAAANSTTGLTASAILGPFWRQDTPHRDNGSSVTFDTPPDGEVVYMHGQVTDVETGEPLQNASREHNLRGIFHTDDQGKYSFYCLRPTPYPVPQDGPAGKLLGMMDRPVFRPAHIHLMVQHKGHKSLTTQIFDKDCKYLGNDSVFAVKDELSVEFVPRKGDPLAPLELCYDIRLAKAS
ncbi:catechol dioxygenase [Metarhizium rileyi]|uniref:Catechol dioxygenase n=1 Tax=Metarhizium rileyi (strain RCEF 4871) TaxID=1649241 RepID=A0A162JXL7_METRR|nr:catechol dioxygenase [Metarhizium rileyi RCEF 4871]